MSNNSEFCICTKFQYFLVHYMLLHIIQAENAHKDEQNLKNQVAITVPQSIGFGKKKNSNFSATQTGQRQYSPVELICGTMAASEVSQLVIIVGGVAL